MKLVSCFHVGVMRRRLSPEEIEKQQREHERDMDRIVSVLMPIAIFFFLLLPIEHFWLSRQ